MKDKIHTALKKYWGYDNFRPQQEDIINAVLINQKDVFVIMPTGGGKSLCFQVPALVSNGLCLVISPLIALIKDQVMQLKRRGIIALSIHTGMTYSEIDNVLKIALHGEVKFLYISPERLQTDLFKSYCPQLKISFVVIDEAHCISQWGHDFRPSYLQIKSIKEFYSDIKFIALTASATRQVQDDIATQLEFKNELTFRSSYTRANLSYNSIESFDKIKRLIEMLKRINGSSIVYCTSRRKCEELSVILKSQKLNVDYYHAGLSNEMRHKKQEAWINNKIDSIICTNAFGMGIDKGDVRLVVHYDLPNCLESFYQEAGRAGRNGENAFSVLLYNKIDCDNLTKKTSTTFPNITTIKKTYEALNNSYKIAIGEGLFYTANFSIENILPLLKNISTIEIVGALNILKISQIINTTDTLYTPAKIMMACNKEYLNNFKQQGAPFIPVIDFIMRNINNVWHDFVIIVTSQIAQQLKLSEEELIRKLLILDKHGIINFIAPIKGEQLIFLIERVTHIEQHIDLNKIQQLKENALKKTQAMINYATINAVCKSKVIANYFGDMIAEDCGICNVCRKQKNISVAEIQDLKNQIVSLLKIEEAPFSTINAKIKNYKNDTLKMVINNMVSENIITYSQEGTFRIKLE